MKRLRRHLTFANMTATIALFVALGGGAYAATSLPKNSVGTAQIKANAVTGAKIKNGSVTAAKIAPGSIGTVASATDANHAVSADTAAHATRADSATRATSAETATRATSAESADRAALAETATRAITAESATRATTADSATTAESATRATTADSATNADHAASADTAAHATSADSAAVAADANTLDGLSSNSFVPASRLLSGAADLTISSPQLLFTIPGGPEIATSGSGTGAFGISIHNPTTSSESWTLVSSGSRLNEVPPGGFGSFGLGGGLAPITVTSESLKRSVTALCTLFPETERMSCAGTLYED